MRKRRGYQCIGDCCFLLFILSGVIVMATPARASEDLPFDPAKICRYSIDNISRSISIRQGDDVWLGYHLENALVFKVWKAPAEKPGVIVQSFKAQSVGSVLFEEPKGEGWQIKISGEIVPLSVRYLGCVQNKGNFELSWELSYPDGTFKLDERIVTMPSPNSSQALRELRFEALPPEVSVLLPAAYREAWVLTGEDGKPAKSFANPEWHQLSLR